MLGCGGIQARDHPAGLGGLVGPATLRPPLEPVSCRLDSAGPSWP